jgi:hypothetical protein
MKAQVKHSKNNQPITLAHQGFAKLCLTSSCLLNKLLFVNPELGEGLMNRSF